MSVKNSEQKISAQVVLPGGPLPPLPEEALEEATQLGALRLYTNHSLIARQLMVGHSINQNLARSYAFRSLQAHPVIVAKRPTELEVTTENRDSTEVFWCAVLGREYFSLLTQITVPLDTEDTYEVSYWSDKRLAKVEISSSLDDAAEKANQTLSPRKTKLVKTPYPDQFNLQKGQNIVATIQRTPTELFRKLAAYSLLGMK
jgi:hypothetical protein